MPVVAHTILVAPVPQSVVAGTSEFALYTELDLNTIPWYTAAGPWGSRYIIPQAAPPVTTTSASPTNLTQFEAALVSGRQITIANGVTIDCGAGVLLASGVSLSDIDIIIEPTGALLNFGLGSYNSGDVCTYNRIRIRGPGASSGGYRGGQLHQFKVIINGNLSSVINDLIIDGVGATAGAADDINATLAIQLQTGNTNSRRFNMANCRVASGGEGYTGDMWDSIIAGNSFLTALTNPETIEDESWGSRITPSAGGSHVFCFNDVRASVPGRTNVFHRARIHPGPEGVGHYWVANNLMVDKVEARLLWCNANAGSGFGWLESFMADSNRYYVEGAGLGYSSESAIYNRFTNETFYSALSLSAASLVVAATINPTQTTPPPPGISTTKVTSGLVFNGSASDPPWEAAGDPSGLNWDI